ncbi:MAG: ATP-binding cassette domain-containing protein [Clostridiales bacterium]|jgi:ATPase subunit of ABC transporter with duplicated ATPase domains|nr:ATP-binding cassette domain-containing protein [Clostridiales bacterium]
MLQTVNVSLQYGKRVLFEGVSLKFTKGNCYGVIGANGAGKSTFLKILSGEIEPNRGEVILDRDERMSVLSQNQNAYDRCTVLETVLRGHKRLTAITEQKNALYEKPDFSEADGMLAGDLEAEYAALGGWESEAEAAALLNGIGIGEAFHQTRMADMDPKSKVKVLLAQAVFFNPDVLMLDEPTNNLDIKTVRWLENFLLNFENTVIIVSHNRHFLNRVCTHICDIDYKKIHIFVGNYDFWYESNQLLQRQAKEANKKIEARREELKSFIARFSANASKSKQATSRKKELEKLTLEDIKPSSRRYPYIEFKPERDLGNEILTVEGLTKAGYFKNLDLTLAKGQKIGFLSDNHLAVTMLFDILNGLERADAGTVKWGGTVTVGYFPENNAAYFEGVERNLVDWLKQYSKDTDETFVRGWLGRMLFSADEALKKASVLSGGERVRCMLARMMLMGGNVLILDEPTNHLDLESITALNKGLVNFKGCLLFSTHDHEIMQTTADRIIELGADGTRFDKLTTYEEYLDLKE